MLIDWFTVGAQALNFVVLVWLMRHFLYKPILHAIDAREKLIAAELADAAAKKAEAHKERDEFEHKNEELDQQRAGLLKKATDDANVERKRLLDEAHTAADELTAKRQETLRIDAKNLDHAIQRRTQQEVFAIARKALTDLATTGLEERLAAVFTRRLQELDGPTKTSLATALKTGSGSAIVRSAFDLPPDQRAVIQNAVNETFSANVQIRFETAPDLVSGIELATNGQKVGWTIADYLKSVHEGVDDLLKKKVAAEVKAEPKQEHTKAEQNGTTTSKTNGAAKVEANGALQNTESGTPKPNVKIESKAEPGPTLKPEAKAEAKPTEPESKTAPMSKPEPKAEAKPEAPADSQSAATAAPKPDVNVSPKPEMSPKAEAPRAKSQ